MSGYHVYRVDARGFDVVHVVTDGQDQETIDAVIEHCKPMGFIACSRNVE